VYDANGVPAGAAPAAAAAPATPATESGVNVPATPAATSTETTVTPEVKTVPLAALEAERQKRHDLERRMAFLEGQQSAARTVETPAPVVAPKAPEPPDIDDFETVEAFNAATTKYIKEVTKLETKEELRQEFQQEAAAEKQQKTAQAVAQTHQARMAKFAETVPDIYTIAQDPTLKINTPMVEVIFNSDAGPALIKHLAENRAEMERIFQLSPTLAAREMGKIEAKLTTPAATSTQTTETRNVSLATEPITTVGTQGSAETDPDNEPIAQYIARMNRAQYGNAPGMRPH
jgi:hypothetical protein